MIPDNGRIAGGKTTKKSADMWSALFHASAKLHSLSLQEDIILMSWRVIGFNFTQTSLECKLSITKLRATDPEGDYMI